MNTVDPGVTGKAGASTINEFCRAHRISRAFFYKLRKQGKGPRVMEVEGRRLISDEAAAAWRHEREATSADA